MTSELNILDGVTATTAELNILDGVTTVAAELNILDGVTAACTVNSISLMALTATALNYARRRKLRDRSTTSRRYCRTPLRMECGVNGEWK